MAQDALPQTPEGRMIEAAAKATGRSIRQLSANAGISDTRWRQIVRGSQPGPGGAKIEVHAPASTLARMALVLGLTPDDLIEADRHDAAVLLRKVISTVRPGDSLFISGAAGDRAASFTVQPDGNVWPTGSLSHSTVVRPVNPDEIDLIYASNMPAREKLLRIRQVLELRALAEAEEREKAPAEAEASEQQDGSAAESQQS